MRARITTTIISIAAVIVFLVAAVHSSQTGGEGGPRSKITLVAPADPGGGWDAFARESQQALRGNGITGNAQVVNIPGAAGTIGLSQVAGMQGREDLLLVTGGVMVGGIIVGDSAVTLDDVTPIARVADDYNVLVVPGDSEFETLDDFLEAFTEDPGGTAIAGGSLGGIDHVLSGLMAQASGIEPSDANYLAYAGGGEVVTSLLSHTTTAGLSGFNEFRDQIESGNLRALAISSEERIDGLDIPTFREAGLDIAMANWRGYVAPPGISDEVHDELVAMLDEMRATPEWQDTLARNGWTDSFMSGTELDDFLRDEIATTTEIVKELGL
ncbi:Bug family tripartite tricarboxylate transporter substrate binding protein [Microbacterium karelineae]|uniref:Bug family tripartite tricarboxylate transporter substrate binding protein n=1 Tax=Microbacterium karelineae TaxID=2654283 RepID=UPI001E46DD1C|nr:tripartite tricarboxylate transporter substrate binding protein [Microbacterium karelineae]